MRVYGSILKLRLLMGMQYRAAALAGVATQFFWGFITIMVFEAFYEYSGATQPISLKEVINYIWLQQAFLVFVTIWFRDTELFDLITSGNIAYELCRPCELYGFWYAKLLAQRLSSALLRCFPILIVAFFLPKPYDLTIPPSFTAFILFISSLVLGLLLLVAVSMFMYISVFLTMSPTGSLLLFSVFGEFFAGLIIPVPLMPDWLQKIAYVLPFRWTADFPFRVYSGHIPQQEAIIGIAIQLVYILCLVWLGRLALNNVLKKVVVQGG
jgi:ABC-2 type transport system permease protein